VRGKYHQGLEHLPEFGEEFEEEEGLRWEQGGEGREEVRVAAEVIEHLEMAVRHYLHGGALTSWKTACVFISENMAVATSHTKRTLRLSR
jgi:hypothetical protein